jgi:hypothetical protein
MKCAVNHTLETGEDGAIVYFFFNASGRALERSTEGMYRCLLSQMLQDLELPESVSSLKLQQYNEDGWPLELLKDLIRRTVSKVIESRPLTCFVDALDEATDEASVREMVEFFDELSEASQSAHEKFSVCFASRHYPTITLLNFEELRLDKHEKHGDDIDTYVNKKLQRSPLKDELASEIRRKASGVFLWVMLVVKILNTEMDRGKQNHLQRKLDELPEGLDSLFDEMLGRGGPEPDSRLVPTILWVMFSHSTAAPPLYFGIRTATDDLTADDVLWDRTLIDEAVITKYLVSSSKGFLEIQEFAIDQNPSDISEQFYSSSGSTVEKKVRFVEEPEIIPDPKPPVFVRFIHETVREYFLARGLSKLTGARNREIGGLAHVSLSHWYWRYIQLVCQPEQMSKFRRFDPVAKEAWKAATWRFPLLNQAVIRFLHHLELADSKGVDTHFPDFDPNTFLLVRAAWRSGRSRHARPYRTMLQDLIEDGCHHSLIARDLRIATTWSPQDRRILLEAQNPMYDGNRDAMRRSAWRHSGTALHIAVEKGKLKLIRALLECGSDVNATQSNGHGTALHAAIIADTELTVDCSQVVQLLLDYGADTTICDMFGNPPLLYAACWGAGRGQDTIRVLLAADADINASGCYSCTALHVAILKNHCETLKLLLDRGADPSLRCGPCGNATQTAEMLGDPGIQAIVASYTTADTAHRPSLDVQDDAAIQSANATWCDEIFRSRYLEVTPQGFHNPPAMTIGEKRAIYERLKRAQAEGALSENVVRMLNLGPG